MIDALPDEDERDGGQVGEGSMESVEEEESWHERI